MLWSKLFVPTRREDHPLAIRAGYTRKHDYLFLGLRVMRKIAAIVREELDRVGAQEFLAESLPALATHAREIRGVKQLPQIWYQVQGLTAEAIAFPSAPFTELGDRILSRCGLIPGAPTFPVPKTPDSEDDLAPELFHTPDQKSIADIARFTGVPETSQMKSVVMRADGAIVLALLRGDHQLDESKLKLTLLSKDMRPASAEEIRKAFGADAGSLGPVGLSNIAVLCDEALRGRRNLICGANRNDYHLRNVTPGKDFEARFFDLRVTNAEPVVQATRAANLEADLFTLSLGRLLHRAIEQNRDADGIVLASSISPFEAVVTPVMINDDAQRVAAQKIYQDLQAAGVDVLLDDRDERPGVKFKDSDLIGVPYRVTIGKKLPQGIVELVTRRKSENGGRQSEDVRIERAASIIKEKLT